MNRQRCLSIGWKEIRRVKSGIIGHFGDTNLARCRLGGTSRILATRFHHGFGTGHSRTRCGWHPRGSAHSRHCRAWSGHTRHAWTALPGTSGRSHGARATRGRCGIGLLPRIRWRWCTATHHEVDTCQQQTDSNHAAAYRQQQGGIVAAAAFFARFFGRIVIVFIIFVSLTCCLWIFHNEAELTR